MCILRMWKNTFYPRTNTEKKTTKKNTGGETNQKQKYKSLVLQPTIKMNQRAMMFLIPARFLAFIKVQQKWIPQQCTGNTAVPEG